MSNRELPMMPWYPDQFRASTATFCWQERALYRALLDAQWSAETLPSSQKLLARAVGMDLRIFRRFWPIVSEKFKPVASGGLQNYRLEQHRLAAIARRDSLASAGRLGGLASVKHRLSNGTSDAQANAEATVNPLSLSPSPQIRNPQPPLEKGAEFLRKKNGRDDRGRSLEAWREGTAALDKIASSEPPLPWSHLNALLHDPLIVPALEAAGGFRTIADRDKFNTKDLQARFREAYESALAKAESAREL